MKVADRKMLDSAAGDGGTFLKIEKGDTKIRVLGPVHAVKEHKYIKPDGKIRFIACPCENDRMAIAAGIKQDGEVAPCPLCNLGYPVQTSYLAKALVREERQGDRVFGGVAGILKKGKTLLGAIQNLLDDPAWSGVEHDIKITATGDGLARKYGVMPLPAQRCAPLSGRENEAVRRLDEKVDLDAMTTPLSFAEIQEEVAGAKPYDEVSYLYEKDN